MEAKRRGLAVSQRDGSFVRAFVSEQQDRGTVPVSCSEIYQGFRNAGVGNVLWFCGSASETASVDNITHAMFVTDVTDKRPGETLTASDVFIAANTSRSNGAYEPLSTYKPNYTDKNYIDGKVYGGNYAASF